MINIAFVSEREFLQKLSDSRAIFLCAGNKLYDYLDKYASIDYQLEYVVDNYKAGESIDIHGTRSIIRNYEQMGPEVKDCIVILTSFKYVIEIIEHLDKMSILNGIDIYIPELFKENYDKYNFNPQLIQVIPKVIHYCWFGNTEIPDKYKANIESWKRCCPDYEIHRWDESNYDITKCEYMKKAYDSRKWGFVPDYARLDIIYNYGGVYLDTDVEMLKSLNPLLGYDLFCGFENKNHVAFGLGFGARKGHHIIKSMIEDYKKMDFIETEVSKDMIASPVHQTRILKEYGLICDGNSRLYDDFLVLSPEYFAPINGMVFVKPTNESFSIHQYAASWYDEKDLNSKNSINEKYKYLMRHVQ